MLQFKTVHRLDEVENVLRRVLQRRGATVHSVAHVGHVFEERGRQPAEDAYVYTVCQANLYAALMAGDIRFAAFLPWRIAAWTQGGAVALEAMSPRECCHLLNRPDLEQPAARLEALLRDAMEEASRPLPAAAQAGRGAVLSGIGATEGQVSIRGPVPQRIDCHGTKIEEIAGTGQHDSAGG